MTRSGNARDESSPRIADRACALGRDLSPGLGSLEIKGEEGRRILPAITMLETGTGSCRMGGNRFSGNHR